MIVKLFHFIFFLFVMMNVNLQQAQAATSWRKGTAIVLFSGVGGGILGLSTLSFYGDPHERTGNVTTGALLGVAAGVGYLLWESAETEQPKETWSFFLAPRGPDDLTLGWTSNF